MRYKVIACKALFREFSLLASQTQTILDITYMRQGLHDTPDLLRRALQEESTGGRQCRHAFQRAKPGPRRRDTVRLRVVLQRRGGLSQKIPVCRAAQCDASAILVAIKSTGVLIRTLVLTGITRPRLKTGGRRLNKPPDEAGGYTALYGEDNALYLVDVETTTKATTTRRISTGTVALSRIRTVHEGCRRLPAGSSIKGDSGWLRLPSRWDHRCRPCGQKLAADYRTYHHRS